MKESRWKKISERKYMKLKKKKKKIKSKYKKVKGKK